MDPNKMSDSHRESYRTYSEFREGYDSQNSQGSKAWNPYPWNNDEWWRNEAWEAGQQPAELDSSDADD